MHGKVPTAAPAGKHKHNCMILAKQAHRRNSHSGEIADHLIYRKNPGRERDVREFSRLVYLLVNLLLCLNTRIVAPDSLAPRMRDV